MPRGPGAGLDAAGDGDGDDRSGEPGAARAVVWLAAGMVLAPFVIQAVRIAVDPATVVLTGDHALIDLAVRDALRGRQELGVYSRIGLFHPGPAMFYLLAPLVAMSGAAAWSTVAATAVLNGILLSTSVLVVGWRWGARLAFSWAVVALGAAVSVGLRLLVVPWNPLLLVPLMVLMLGLVVSSDRIVAWAGALAVGSVLVQTHLATAPTVAALVALATVIAGREQLARRRQGAGGPTGGELAVAAAAAGGAVVVWIPPLVQQLTAEPGNLGLVVRYFAGSEEVPGSIMRSLAAAGRSLNLLSPRVTGSLDSEAFSWAAVVAVTLVCAGIASAFGATLVHRRMAAATLVSTAAVTLSATRITGSRFWYLTLWMGVSVVPLLVGAVDGILASVSRRAGSAPLQRAGAVAPIAAVGALALAAVAPVLSGPPFTPEEFPNFPSLRCQVENMVDAVALGPQDGAAVLHIDVDGRAWVAGVGLAVELESRGVEVYFDAEMAGFVPDHRIARERAERSVLVAPAEADCS